VPPLFASFLLVSLLAVQQTPPPSIEVPYKGLRFLMASRDGVTVMLASLDRTILDYATAQVWISNNSGRPLPIAPQAFVRIAEDGKSQPATADATVLRDIQRRARSRDVDELVKAYEAMLMGLPNQSAVGYYQQRKRAAMASGGKQRAAVMANVIILPERVLRPGETIDGTLFFRESVPRARVTAFTAEIAGRRFEFTQ
jgi:hypothetical protein